MSETLNWIHLDFSDSEAVQRVRQDKLIPTVVADALVADDSRPRTVPVGEGVLVILRGVNLNQGADIEDMISIRIWVEPDRVVSTSRRFLKSVDQIRRTVESGEGPRTGGAFLALLAGRLGDFISDAVEQIEEGLEVAENQVNDPDIIVMNSPFSVLRRQTARIRRYMSPQRDALERLARFNGSLFSESELMQFQEQANRMALILEDIDLVRERALVAQEEFLGILAHEQNTRMLLLSIVAAIFLPMSFLTGLMGMNVAGLPGLENPAAFWILVVLMVVLTGGILALFRWRRWI